VVFDETRPHGCLYLGEVSMAGRLRWGIQELSKAIALSNTNPGSGSRHQPGIFAP
jgi:hypothetical protein